MVMCKHELRGNLGLMYGGQRLDWCTACGANLLDNVPVMREQAVSYETVGIDPRAGGAAFGRRRELRRVTIYPSTPHNRLYNPVDGRQLLRSLG